MSNGMIHVQRSFRELLPAFSSSDWLKVDFWIHGPVAADTSYSERLLFIGLPLCNVFAATGPCIKNQLLTNQNLLNARADSWNDYWTCITLHSVLPLNNKSYQKHQIHACANFTYVHVFRSTHVGPDTYASKFAYWLLYIYLSDIHTHRIYTYQQIYIHVHHTGIIALTEY